MAIACPACGKKSEDVRECPRCGCELSILEMITRAAAPEAARLAFLSALSVNDLVQVDRWYARASGSARESGVSQDISLRPTSKIPA